METKIHFPQGLIGLENYRDFILKELPEQTLFWLLQSAEDQYLGLVVTNPFWFMPDYEFELPDAYEEQMGADKCLNVLVTVTLAPTPENITVNLMGPIVYNENSKVGFQVLAASKDYPSRYKLMSAKLAGG